MDFWATRLLDLQLTGSIYPLISKFGHSEDIKMTSRIPNLLVGTLIGTVFIMGQDGREHGYYTSRNGSNTTVIGLDKDSSSNYISQKGDLTVVTPISGGSRDMTLIKSIGNDQDGRDEPSIW